MSENLSVSAGKFTVQRAPQNIRKKDDMITTIKVTGADSQANSTLLVGYVLMSQMQKEYVVYAIIRFTAAMIARTIIEGMKSP